MGFIFAVILLGICGIFVYDYVLFKKEKSTVVGYTQVMDG